MMLWSILTPQMCCPQSAPCRGKAQWRCRQLLLCQVVFPQMAVFLQSRPTLLRYQVLLPPHQVRTCSAPANVICSGFGDKPLQYWKIWDNFRNYGTFEKVLRYMLQRTCRLDPINLWGLRMGLWHHKSACDHWIYFQEQLESNADILIPQVKLQMWCKA